MTRIIVTALSAVTMLFVGIISLSYRSQNVADAGFSQNATHEAFNTTQLVTTDATGIVGNALPRLFVIVLLALIAGVLVMNRP